MYLSLLHTLSAFIGEWQACAVLSARTVALSRVYMYARGVEERGSASYPTTAL